MADPGVRVHRGDRVTLDGKPVDWEQHVFLSDADSDSDSESRGTRVGGLGEAGDAGAARRVYIKYWKPRCVGEWVQVRMYV